MSFSLKKLAGLLIEVKEDGPPSSKSSTVPVPGSPPGSYASSVQTSRPLADPKLVEALMEAIDKSSGADFVAFKRMFASLSVITDEGMRYQAAFKAAQDTHGVNLSLLIQASEQRKRLLEREVSETHQEFEQNEQTTISGKEQRMSAIDTELKSLQQKIADLQAKITNLQNERRSLEMERSNEQKKFQSQRTKFDSAVEEVRRLIEDEQQKVERYLRNSK